LDREPLGLDEVDDGADPVGPLALALVVPAVADPVGPAALALIPVPAPPPPAGGLPPRVPRGPRNEWECYPVTRDGIFYGFLKYGGDRVMSAHCRWCADGAETAGLGDHAVCRFNRSTKFGTRPQQGRPIGLLLAWLFRAPRFADNQEHFDDKAPGIISYDERVDARDWAEGSMAMATPLSWERPRRAGEPAEPLEAP
jgi:hypothetical protein